MCPALSYLKQVTTTNRHKNVKHHGDLYQSEVVVLSKLICFAGELEDAISEFISVVLVVE